MRGRAIGKKTEEGGRGFVAVPLRNTGGGTQEGAGRYEAAARKVYGNTSTRS
jgi:hypothetical protein